MQNDDRVTVPTLVIHVGMPKTGSSYLQSMFALNAEQLSLQGFLYPNHETTGEAKLGRITSGNFPGWRSLRQFMDDNSTRNAVTVFSSENLFYPLGRPEHVGWHLLNQLNREFSVKLLLFVRNPIEHKKSQHQQLVKRHGLVEEFDQWIRSEDLAPIAEFVSAAKNNVDELEILNFSNHKNNLWESALGAIGWTAGTKSNWLYPQNVIVNRSLSAAEMRIQIAANTISGWESRRRVLADQFCNFAPDVEPAETALSEAGYATFVHRIADQVVRSNQLVPESERLVLEGFSSRWARAFEQSRAEVLALDSASWSALVVKLEETSGKSKARVEAKLARHVRRPARGPEEALSELEVQKRKVLPLVRSVWKMSVPMSVRMLKRISRFADWLYRFMRKWRLSRRGLEFMSKSYR